MYVYHFPLPDDHTGLRGGSSGFAERGCGLTSEVVGHLRCTEKQLTQKRAHGHMSDCSQTHVMSRAPPPLSGPALVGDGAGGSWEPLPSQLGFQLPPSAQGE